MTIRLGLSSTPDNYRAEMARYRITQRRLAQEIGLNRQQLSMILADYRPLRIGTATIISGGINRLVGWEVFDMDPDSIRASVADCGG